MSRASGRVALVAALTHQPSPGGAGPPPIPPGVQHLEVRADLCGEVDTGLLRRGFSGRLIYNLRSTRHGGHCADPPAERHHKLMAAADRYDMIDMEADHDLVPEVLRAVPPHRRRISWHGAARSLPRLAERFAALAAVPAALYLLAPATLAAEQALIPLRLLAMLRRRDVTAYGDGPLAGWSRLLAPWFGAPTLGAWLDAGNRPGDPGDPGDGTPRLSTLCADYPFPDVPPVGALCGLVGPAAARSSFPRLHNAGYRRYGDARLPGLFLPFYLTGLGDFPGGFWPGVPAGLAGLGVPLRGLSVSAPLKEAAVRVADDAGPTARTAASANALIHRDGRWRAETTDGMAVARVLRRAGVRAGHRRIAVVGCGGAGRAIALALAAGGAAVTLVNRDERRGRLVADLLRLPFTPLASFAPAGPALVVHATPNTADPPFRLDRLSADAVVLDMVCPPAGAVPADTPLVRTARRRGLRAIDGRQVLAAEAALQFRLMTGRAMPPVADPPTGSRRAEIVPAGKG